MAERRSLRIFISSPGDVASERRRAALVVRRLRREFDRFFELAAVLWEFEVMLAHGHFQDVIEKPSQTDIFVMILWSRLGTPLPERYHGIDRRIPVTGTEWEFEDALAARQQRGVPDLLVYRKQVAATARFSSGEELEEAGRQWAALEVFWERHFGSTELGVKLAYNRFSGLDAFEMRLEEDLRELLRKRLVADKEPGSPLARIIWHDNSPFRGLQSFGLEHAPVFFGRSQAEREVVEALVQRASEGCAFLLILGASGVGKSSLAQAAALPSLMSPGVVSKVDIWRHCVFRPGAAVETEGDIFARLARALMSPLVLPELSAAGLEPSEFERVLRYAPAQISALVKVGLTRLQQAAGEEARLALVVDQLEELFTQVPENERARFVTTLEALALSGVVWVLATMRSDFFPQLAGLPTLRDLVADSGSYLLMPPRLAEIGQMIRQPASAAGLDFEVDKDGIGLDSVLEEAAAQEPGAVPLLEFALDELYRMDVEEGRGTQLTLKSYHALGTFEGAIAARAEKICGALGEAEHAALPSVLLALVSSAESQTARPVPRVQVATTSARASVLDAMIAARLVVSGGETAGATVRIAHEALIGHWPRFANLIAENRAFLLASQLLEQERTLWEREGRRDDLVIPAGIRLAEAAELLRTRRSDLKPEMIAFIERSLERDGRERDRRLRQAWLVTGGMTALALCAAVFGWFGWTSSMEAGRQKMQAEANFNMAMSAANNIVVNVAEKIRPVAGMAATTVGDILAGAEKIYDDLQRAAPVSQELSYRRALMLLATAETYETLGNLEAERRRADEARALMQALVAKKPDNGDWEYALSTSYYDLGNALRAEGNMSDALAAYRASQDIRLRLSQLYPAATWLQRALAQSYIRIGDVLYAQRDPLQDLAAKALGREVVAARGDPSGAVAAYRMAQQIMQQLAAQAPIDADQQNGLAVTYERVGNTLRDQGDLPGALAAYRAGRQIIESLTRRYPNNMGFWVDLSKSQESEGFILNEQNDLVGALAAYRACLQIRQSLVQRDPSNAGWQSLLALAYHDLGQLSKAEGNTVGAIEAYRSSLQIMESLTRSSPQNTEWQNFLSTIYLEIGQALQAQHDLPNAVAMYRASQQIMEGLAHQDPGNAQWQAGRISTLMKQSDVLLEQGDPAGALAVLRAELRLLEHLAQLYPGNVEWQNGIAVVYDMMGLILHQQQHDLPGAIAGYRAALDVAERLFSGAPNDARWEDLVVLNLMALGELVPKGEASALLGRARLLAQHLVTAHPNSKRFQSYLVGIEQLCQTGLCSPP